jgi:hypothetical protein
MGRMGTDTTKVSNNGRVVPLRTERFDRPIRYINSDVQRGPAVIVAGSKPLYQQDQEVQRKSSQHSPTGLGNPWELGRHPHDYFMEGNWTHLDNYVGFAETNNHGLEDDSTTNFTKNMSNRVTNAQTTSSHSKQARNRYSAEVKDQSKPEPTTDLSIETRGNVGRRNIDPMWK